MLKTFTPLALLLALPAAWAQPTAPQRWVEWVARAPIELALDAPLAGLAGRELGGEPVVKGAPFCATAVHESIQALSDGNRIVRKQSTQLCRDGEGRTRREVQQQGGPTRVYLHDPVARESWLLEPERKTARRLPVGLGLGLAPRSPDAPRADAAALARDHAAMAREHGEFVARWREQSERWRDWAQEVAKRARGQAGVARPAPAASASEPAVVIEEAVVSRDGQGEPRRSHEVRVLRLSELPALGPLPPQPPMPPLPPMQPLFGGAFFAGSGSLGPGVLTALPAREIEGVKVSGERTQWTIPAGQLGNEKPIVISREVWRSPELMLTLSSRDVDPRNGETHYRLEKLKRGEPDAALMRLPPDYRQSPERRAPQPPSPPAQG